jgi:hypothetical protein
VKREQIAHQFVEYIPEQLEEGVVYVSIRYATAMHRCFCGCGSEVVTPISPTDWTLIFDGRTISLDPSVGSWNLPCRSHYWITHNRVEWAHRWTERRIAAARERERREKERYFAGLAPSDTPQSEHPPPPKPRRK